MNKKIFNFLMVSVLIFSFSANSAWAQFKIVPDCAAGGDCSVCDFLATLINFTNIVGAAAGTSAVLMLIIGGVMWILAGANENMIEKGKKIVVGTFTGLVIVFFAWTVVNFLIYALRGDSLNNVMIFSQEWWSPDCPQPPPPQDCREAYKLKVGDSCLDEIHYCYRAGAAAAEECTSGDKSCQCVSWCHYMANTSGAEYACVNNGESCATGYQNAGESLCSEDTTCCLKFGE